MNTRTDMKKRNGIELLRGLSITGIVLYHLTPKLCPGGFLGVLLFFVLSGYLMYVTCENEWRKGTFHIVHFYRKRLLKIIPPLFFMVMVFCSYLTITKNSCMAGIWKELCSIFLGFDNWWQIGKHASYFSRLAAASPFTHLWFLAVEMQFYLLWPFLFVLYKRSSEHIGGEKMCFLFLGLAFLSAGKMFILYHTGDDPSRVYYGTDTMSFSLFIGSFLGAYRQEYFSKRKSRNGVFLFCSLFTACLFLFVKGEAPFLYKGGMFFISLFFAAFLHLTESKEEAENKDFQFFFLSLLGKNSYSIYLWHYPLIFLTLPGAS